MDVDAGPFRIVIKSGYQEFDQHPVKERLEALRQIAETMGLPAHLDCTGNGQLVLEVGWRGEAHAAP